MHDLEELKGRSFRMSLAATNYQAVFGAVALALIGLAAIIWHERNALFLVLASCFCAFSSNVVQSRALARVVFSEIKPTKLSILATHALWYAAMAFGAFAFTALN